MFSKHFFLHRVLLGQGKPLTTLCLGLMSKNHTLGGVLYCHLNTVYLGMTFLSQSLKIFEIGTMPVLLLDPYEHHEYLSKVSS